MKRIQPQKTFRLQEELSQANGLPGISFLLGEVGALVVPCLLPKGESAFTGLFMGLLTGLFLNRLSISSCFFFAAATTDAFC